MNRIIIILLLISPCLFADINGDISIGKSGEHYRADVKLGYNFDISKFNIVPYIDYVNYFRNDGMANHPYRDVFGTGLRVNYTLKDGTAYIDIRHECRHEVSSLNRGDMPLLYSEAIPNDSSTFITVGYKWGYDYD